MILRLCCRLPQSCHSSAHFHFVLQVSDKHDEKSEALLRRGWCEIATISEQVNGYTVEDRNMLGFT